MYVVVLTVNILFMHIVCAYMLYVVYGVYACLLRTPACHVWIVCVCVCVYLLYARCILCNLCTIVCTHGVYAVCPHAMNGCCALCVLPMSSMHVFRVYHVHMLC